jgi:streptomycin 6-kinase
MIELNGEDGAAWIKALPALLDQYAQRWSLQLQPPFELSYNYAAPAIRSDGARLVLKVGVVNPELLSEIAALRLFDGRGMVRLIDADPQQGVMLLERLEPGTPLLHLDDEEATTIAAHLMRQLWRPVPADHPFPHVADWSAGLQRLRAEFEDGTGPFPRRMVEMAETLFAELLASMDELVLLHGDLHHWNILSAGRQPWLAIDPKGIVGEPAYEIGAWLRNPELMSRQVQARRVDQFSAELGFDRERILGWGVAQAVLSGWWSYEDHGYGWEPAVAEAEILASLMNQASP